MKVSQAYYEKTSKRYLYNITLIDNIASIIQYGILCKDEADKLEHRSIAMAEVQAKRDKIRVPNGLMLHQYANLYFAYNNPMMYKRKNEAEELCILAVRNDVLDIDGCIVSDSNAASEYARFYAPSEGIKALNFDLIFAQYWTSNDYYEERRRKAIKCAEVLIPHDIPLSYIESACVLDQNAESRMRALGFQKQIVIRPEVLFRQEVIS